MKNVQCHYCESILGKAHRIGIALQWVRVIDKDIVFKLSRGVHILTRSNTKNGALDNFFRLGMLF